MKIFITVMIALLGFSNIVFADTKKDSRNSMYPPDGVLVAVCDPICMNGCSNKYNTDTASCAGLKGKGQKNCLNEAEASNTNCISGCCPGIGGGDSGPEICNDGIDNDLDKKTDCADKQDCNKSPYCK